MTWGRLAFWRRPPTVVRLNEKVQVYFAGARWVGEVNALEAHGYESHDEVVLNIRVTVRPRPMRFDGVR